MIDQNLLEEKLRKYNQEHIIEHLDNLQNEQKEEFLQELCKIDLEQIMNLYNETKKIKVPAKTEITPIDYIDKDKISQEEKYNLQSIGKKIIMNNQYAVVTMAGRSRN